MALSVEIEQLKHAKDLPLPNYATSGSAGADLFAAIAHDVVIPPRGIAAIPTGIKIAIPEGYEGQVRPRSGLARRQGVTVLNAPGTIDSDYRGEVEVLLINHSDVDCHIRRGDRIAQIIFARVERAEWQTVAALPATGRAEGGFGHTGR